MAKFTCDKTFFRLFCLAFLKFFYHFEITLLQNDEFGLIELTGIDNLGVTSIALVLLCVRINSEN